MASMVSEEAKKCIFMNIQFHALSRVSIIIWILLWSNGVEAIVAKYIIEKWLENVIQMTAEEK